jgi:phage tail-like protein
VADELLRAFRFRVKLRRSPGGASGGVSSSAGLAIGASASLSAGLSADVSASASASFSLGAGASLSAGASIDASASAGVSAAVGVGAPPGAELGDGAFQECSGLEVEMDVGEYLEGGRNANVVRQVGRAKYQSLILKRGMLFSGGQVNGEFWNWLQNTIAGLRPVVRYDGTIQVMSAGDEVVARWQFERGLPARIRGPELNARTGEIAIEELHIAHEGLRLLS